MTGEHTRAIDRVAEAAKSIDADIVVVVQGDEPLIYPDMVDTAVASVVKNPNIRVATMAKQIQDETIFEDPNFAKIVVDTDMNALYFCREPIPSRYEQSFEELSPYKHLAVIPFTKQFLMKFANLSETPLERAESVDLNRAIEHGYNVRIVEVNRDVYQVDTPEDHDKVNKLMESDKLWSKYN
jgi:3-deoxy-manno-octulosonate cytidylyltransferase (CMP-KDO synthetase)